MADTYALVTGASSGIGLAIARQLALRGYHLLLVSNEKERLEALCPALAKEYRVDVAMMATDLARKEAAQEVYDFCRDKGLEVEVLVNNAGFFFFGEAVEANTEKAGNMVLLHTVTSSLLCTLFGKDMKQRKKGYILNNASISGYTSFPGIAYYASTKAYIKLFTQSLRTELRVYGIQVTCLCPGATDTNLYDTKQFNMDLAKKLGIMLSAEKVAAAGVNGLFRNKAVVVPGLVTKVMLFFSLLTPQWVIYLIRKRAKWLK